MADTDPPHDPERPPVVILPRVLWRGVVWSLVLLGSAAVIGSFVAAVNAADSHDGLAAITEELDDQRDQNAELRQQLDCRYVLTADRDRIQSDIFTTVALALAAARDRNRAAVALYAEHLTTLAADLDRANDLRDRAIEVCETEPENVLG